MAVAGRGTSDINYETSDDQREICEMCDVTTAAGYCVDCEMYICQSCFDMHIKLKKCRGHVLQDITEKKTGLTPIRFDKCDEHAQQEVKLYCTDHKLTGCAECMLFEHKTCKHEYITEAAKKFEESGEFVRVRENIQMLEATHAEYTNAIVSKTNATEMMTKSATDDIESFTESIITYANDAKQRVLEEVRVRESANKLQIDQLEDEIQTISSQLDVLSSAFEDEKEVHKLFLLAIDAKPKLSSIRDAFSSIDCSSIITDYKFETSKMLQDMVSNSRPFGRFKDNSQNQIGDDDDLDFMLKQERQQALQQLSQQENELQKLTSNILKLEDEHATLKQSYDKTVHERQQLESEITKLKLEHGKMETKIHRMRKHVAPLPAFVPKCWELVLKNEVTLSCGHTSSIEKMEKNRTIGCNVCSNTFGDQPEGTMQSTVKTFDSYATYYELQFTFPHGKQSKLNCNPGNSYTGTSMKGYLVNDGEGSDILKMLRQAFDRKLLFTVDKRSSITLGGIELFKEVPIYWLGLMLMDRSEYRGYIDRVKGQLAAVGITN